MNKKVLVAIICAVILHYAEARCPNANDNRAPLQSSDLGDDSRAIADVWESIKATAQRTWDSIKYMAARTRATIKAWLGKVREQAKKVSEIFEERIEIIKQNYKNILENLIMTGQLVKKCVQEENETIEKLLTQIIDYVTSCVAENVTKLQTLEGHDFISGVNDSKYLEEINSKINKCSKENDVAKCVQKVRKDIFDEMDTMENVILESSAESRRAADGALGAALACALRGAVDAQDAVGALLQRTVACVAVANNNTIEENNSVN